MDPREIFDLLVRADEAIKYAREDRTEVRVRRARDLVSRALREAREAGNQGLVEQARRRLQDLEALAGPADAAGPAP